jgi:threonine dehydrogenase-like Zn-dependent dehydrogenase
MPRKMTMASLDLLDGLVNTSEMITHTFPLERIDEAFQMRNDPKSGAIHILIDCERP